MYESHTHVATANAERLTKRLCNHWRHKFPVDIEAGSAKIQFPNGVCSLTNVDGGLAVSMQVSEENELPRMRQVVADHLQRMAGDEPLTFNWS